MDEVKNSNVSFNNKTYVDTLLQKVWVKERASERLIFNNVIQKKNIVRQRATHKKHADNQPIMLVHDLATCAKRFFK